MKRIEGQRSITAVVLNWRLPNETITCVESLETSLSPVDVIIVDNDSRDDSEQLLRRRFPQHRIIQSGANLGFGGGCNVGILAALDSGADYILLLNNDAVIESTTISALLSRALRNSRIGIVGTPIRNLPDNGNLQEWGGGSVNLLLGTSKPASQKIDEGELHYICGACMLLSARMLREIGLFDEERFFLYWEDVDLSFRAVKAGWNLAVAENALVFHRGNSSSGWGSSLQSVHFNASAVQFFQKHSPFPSIPIAIGTAMRIGRALTQADPLRAWNTLCGVRKGLGRAAIRM